MKKLITTVILCCMVFTVTNAQNFINLIPSKATVVIRYSGDNFTKSLPLEKLDRYGFIKNDFLKILHIDTLTSLQNIGINFSEDFYQYVITEDTCISFVTLLNIKNESQFLKLIKANYGSLKKITKKKGISFLPVSETSYIGWGKTKAVIVNTSYQNRQSYYNYYPAEYTDTVTAAVDSTIAITEIKPEKITEEIDTSVIISDSAVAIVEDKIEEIADDSVQRIADSLNNLKWELWNQQQDIIAKKQQQAAAENIINYSFAGNITSIKNDLSYKKTIDPTAHVSVWMKTESIFSQYSNYFNRGGYSMFGKKSFSSADTSSDFNSAVNMYFEKDKLRMDSKSFSADAKMNNMMLDVMNNKQHTNLINYVNPGNIGYFSVSINTQAMANYYYPLLKKYMGSQFYTKDYSDIVDIYIDLLEIIIDEKAIADLLPGNYMFVMHDLKPQIVDYTDYEYDEEYNRKEVKKTKKELSPDFTFAIETKREDFMQKLARLPVKYAKKEGYNYKEKEGYYELVFDTGKYPIKSLYFMVKDGKAIVTTSKEVINMTINSTGFAIDEATKNTILNNNYALHINTKRLIEKLDTQLSSDVNKKITDYLLNNMGDLKMESRVKDDIIQGTTILNIKGSHNNSLEFFFNMMESINNIMEQDKQEKEKKLL
jgi:hypothetical protein